MGMATCKAGDICDQPFFRPTDWKAVEELRVPPPFVPEVVSSARAWVSGCQTLEVTLEVVLQLWMSTLTPMSGPKKPATHQTKNPKDLKQGRAKLRQRLHRVHVRTVAR